MNATNALKAVIALLALYALDSGFAIGRYDIGNSVIGKRKIERSYTVNVKNPIPLREFVTLLSGITKQRIVLMDEGSEKVWFVGKGSLEKILDTVLYPIGYYWEREGDKIVIRKFVSRIWKLYIPKLSSEVTFTAQGTNLSYTYDYTGKLGETIRRILSPFVERGRIEVDPVTGIVSFYGTYKEMKAVEEVLEKLQDMLTQRVVLKMDVYALVLNDEYQTGIDLSMFLRDPTRIGVNLLTSQANSPFSLTFQTTSVEGLLTLLEKFGKVKILESRVFNSITGFPIVMTQVREREYLKETRIGYIAPQQGVGYVVPTLEVRQEKVDEGSQMVLIPQKLSEDRIVLEVAYGNKRINAIERKTFVVQSQETSLESPDVSRSDFSVNSVLEEGQSLVLVSSIMDSEKLSSRGVPFLSRIPVIKHLFGSHYKDKRKVQLIVTITYLGEEYGVGFREEGTTEGRGSYFPK